MKATNTKRILMLIMTGSAMALLWRQIAVQRHMSIGPLKPAMPVVANGVAMPPEQKEENPLLVQLRSQAEAANSVPEGRRELAWSRLVKSFPVANTPQLLQALSAADDEASVELRQLLVRRWAGEDPTAAADWTVRFASPLVQKELMQQVAVVWAQTDMTNAIQWAQSLPNELHSDVCLTLAYEAARTDPQTALTLAADLPANPAGNELVSHAAAQWAAGDPAAAAQWAKQIPDEALRDQVLSSIATEWGTKDPVAAANLALDSIPAGRPQEDAIIGIVQRWAQTDPLSAANWVTAFPQGTLQQTAIENLVKPWAVHDALQAGQWLKTLKPGAVRDAAMVAYSAVAGTEQQQP